MALPALVAAALDRYGLANPVGWLEQRLQAGDCVVMLDGLDEVARQEDRQAVSEWVSVQVTRYRGNDFVVTSRPLGYLSAPIEGALTLQTQPFTPNQVSRFVHGWYLAEERHRTGIADDSITRRAAAEAEDLLGRLKATPALRDLTVNPLLLTMIATVHKHGGALPGSRADLYAQICQVLLWRRQGAKKLQVEPRGEQKERLMRVLALEMMRRNARDLSRKEVLAILRPALRRINRDLAAEDVLDDAASNGLFVERETGLWAFAHQTFQEYLAAARIKERHQEAILTNAVSDIWWRETTLLYVAGADAGPIIEACLAARTVPALTLAFDCADEAGELAEELREQLDGLLAEGLAPYADPRHRRLMTAVMLTRHLRDTIETDSGTRVCRRPVTVGAYQIFAEDMKARGQPRPLDAPPHTATDDPDQVAAGMRESDVTAFVGWANEITGGQSAYRLPSPAEIRHPPVRDAVAPGRASRLIWSGSVKRAGRNPSSTRREISRPAGPGSARSGNSSKPISPPLRTRSASCPCSSTPAWLRKFMILVARRAAIGTFGLLENLTGALEPGPACGRYRAIVRFLDASARVYWDDPAGMAAGKSVPGSLYSADVQAADSDAVVRDVGLIREFGRDLLRSDAHEFQPGSEKMHQLERDYFRLARDLALFHNLRFARDIHARLLDKIGVGFADFLSQVVGYAIPDPWFSNAQTADPRFASAPMLVLGYAFDRMLSGLREAGGPAVMRVVPFRRFGDVTAVGADGYDMPPDLLAPAVRHAIGRLKAGWSESRAPRSWWAGLIADRFDSPMERILLREQPVQEPVGLLLRIMTLCLAAEASALDDRDLADEFRQIVSGIAWLELRHRGVDPAVETIVLALD